MSHDPKNVHLPEMPLPPMPPPEDDGWDIDAIRRQVAEEIASKADEIAHGFQVIAIAHSEYTAELCPADTADATPHEVRHHRIASAFLNRADGAWAVAQAAREIGARGTS